MVNPQVAAWGEANKPRVFDFLRFLDGELKGRPYVAGEDYSVADITALVAVDFMRVSKLAVPDDLATCGAGTRRCPRGRARRLRVAFGTEEPPVVRRIVAPRGRHPVCSAPLAAAARIGTETRVRLGAHRPLLADFQIEQKLISIILTAKTAEWRPLQVALGSEIAVENPFPLCFETRSSFGKLG